MGDLGPLLWAKNFRKINVKGDYKSFSISRDPFIYPFLREIYNVMLKPDFKELVVKKPTQIGLTELAVNTTFYFLDTKGENVIYMLPSADQLSDFVQARLNKVIEKSPHISDMFMDTDNVGLKVGNRASLYLRGSNSESKLEEVPAGMLVRDEYSFMNMDNAKKAKNRLDASANKWILDISHPRFPDQGIDKRYKDSTQQKWIVTCESCGAEQELSWPDSVDMEKEELVCKSCGEEVNPLNGEWSEGGDNPVKGFDLSQFLSPTVSLKRIIKDYQEASSARDMRLFHNNRLGNAWSSSQRQLSRSDIVEKIVGKKELDDSDGSTVIGVDVGERELFYWVQAGNNVLDIGLVRNFEGLEKILDEHQVRIGVVDLEPEARRARRWAEKVRGEGNADIWLCYRSDNLESERIVHEEDREIKINKTDQLDEFFYQFTDGEIHLPSGLSEEVINHLQAPTRVIEEVRGHQKARWKKNNSDYADAGAYAKSAQQLLNNVTTQDVWKGGWEEDESIGGIDDLMGSSQFKEFDPMEVLLNE